MKSVFVLTLSAAALSSLALPAMAQDYYRPAELRPSYDDGTYLRPPLPVSPSLRAYDDPGGSVVTTTRRVERMPGEDGYGTTRTVVTTRRVVTQRDEPLGILDAGPVLARPLPPPIRRVSKDPYEPPVFGGPYLAVAPRLAPRRPVVIEERRVETTRRYVAPGYVAPDDAEIDD